MTTRKDPIYFYPDSDHPLHDAKFMEIHILLNSNIFRKDRIKDIIESAYLIEKVQRFQKIMSLLCFAREKRFVQMSKFQEVGSKLVDVASQAQKFRKTLAIKWFSNLLGDDEKPQVRSAFRQANPLPHADHAKYR